MYYLPMLMKKLKKNTKKDILKDFFVFNKYFYGYELRFRLELELIGDVNYSFNLQTSNDRITRDMIMTT